MSNKSVGFLAKEIRNARLFVGLKGATLRCVQSDGLIRWEVGVPPGVNYCDVYPPYMGRGDTLEVQGGNFVRSGGGSLGRMEAMSFGDKAFESGANSDWTAPVRTIEQREADMMARLAKTMERKFRAREKALRAAVQNEKQSTVIEKENGDGETSKATDQQKQAQQTPEPQGDDETGQVQLQKEAVKTDE